MEAIGQDIAGFDAQVLGISVDSSPSHKAFARECGVTFPLLSDFHREVSKLYGVYLEDKGISMRATFIVDKEGILRYHLISDLDIRRDEKEVLRVLRVIAGK